MPPNRPPTAAPGQPAEQEPERYTLECYTFTGPERAEVQVYFDTAYGDLLTYIEQSWDPNREGPMQSAIVTREGARWFPDQIIAYMLWVQERRTRPDAQLAEFDGLTLAELNGAAVRGWLGKVRARSTKPETSGPGPDSSGSTEAGSRGKSRAGSRGSNTTT